MKKEDFIKRRGQAAYDKQLQQGRDWKAWHHEESNVQSRMWAVNNSERGKANDREKCRKGGKNYAHTLEYHKTGLQGEKNKIRSRHAHHYYRYKRLIAPASQIHHEWIPGTADFRGIALVEANQHMHGFVDVIKILNGKITLLTEKEVKRGV